MFKYFFNLVLLLLLVGCSSFKSNNMFNLTDHGLNNKSERIYILERKDGAYDLSGAEKNGKIINFQIYEKNSGVNTSILFNEKGEVIKISFGNATEDKVINVTNTDGYWEVN